MKKWLHYLPVWLFALFIVGFSILDVATPDRAFSELENRKLAKFTPPTFQNLISGKFFTNYETYVNDQFVFREEWITLKSAGEAMLLKTENNNIVYGEHGYLFDKTVSFDTDRIASNFAHIQEFAGQHSTTPIYFSLIPNSSEIMSDYLPIGLKLPSQMNHIAALYAQLPTSGNLTAIDVGTPLLGAHIMPEAYLTPDIPTMNRESSQGFSVPSYLYYRTDHHWTFHGAQIAYTEYLRQTAPPQKPQPADGFVVVDNFYGTLFNKAKKIGTKPDTIMYYNYAIESITVDGELKPTLHNIEQFNKHDKYAGLLWGNNAITVINRQGYSTANNPTRILIIKDSYGNTLAPFFLEHYDQVVMVDLRYTTGIEELLKSTQFNTIYIVYSFANFGTDDNIIKLLPEEPFNTTQTEGRPTPMNTQPLDCTIITPQEAYNTMTNEPNTIVLDVRTQEEYNAEHIPGAKLLPLDKLAERAAIELPKKNALVLVYCRSGQRSTTACELLKELGYTNVKNFGGIMSWPYETVSDYM